LRDETGGMIYMYDKEELEHDVDYLVGNQLDEEEARDFIMSIIRQSNGKLED
jgi:hypothetical protein